MITSSQQSVGTAQAPTDMWRTHRMRSLSPGGHVYRDLRARNPGGVCGGQEPLLVHLERHSTLEACCFYLAEGTDGTINDTKWFLRNSGLGPFSTTLGGI